MADQIDEEIQKEIKANKILIYGKGTKTMPMCGFTRETMQFFDKYGYPYELVDVLSQPAKREGIHRRTVFWRYGHPGSDGSQRRSRTSAEESLRRRVGHVYSLRYCHDVLSKFLREFPLADRISHTTYGRGYSREDSALCGS